MLRIFLTKRSFVGLLLLGSCISGASRAQTPDDLAEARRHFRERDFDAAIVILERLRASRPDAEVYRLLGLSHARLDRLDRAEPFLKASAELTPEDHLARYHLGMLYYLMSRFEAAAGEFRAAIGLLPAFMKGHDGLGLALEELGPPEAAIASYRRAIALAEEQRLGDASPYLNLGKFLITQNRAAESLSLLERAATLAPASADAAYFLGKALDKAGRPDQAIASLNRAVRNDPRSAEAHYLLSRIYLRQGRDEEARKALERFQELKKK